MSWTSERFWRLFSLDDWFASSELKRILHIRWELLESARDAASSWLGRLECYFLHHWRLWRSLGSFCWNGHIFTVYLQVLIEKSDRFGSLRERLFLHKFLGLLELLLCECLGIVVVVWHKLRLGCKKSPLANLSTLWRVGKNVLRCNHNISLFIGVLFFDFNSVSHMFVRGFNFLLNGLRWLEVFIMTSLYVTVFN